MTEVGEQDSGGRRSKPIKPCKPWERPDIEERARALGIKPSMFWAQLQRGSVTREPSGEKDPPDYLNPIKLKDPNLPHQGYQVFNPLAPQRLFEYNPQKRRRSKQSEHR